MKHKDANLRQLRVSMDAMSDQINTYFSTQIVDQFIDAPVNIVSLSVYEKGDELCLSSGEIDENGTAKRETLLVEPGHWAEKALEYARVTGSRGVIWDKRELGAAFNSNAKFVIRELCRLGILKVLVVENDDGNVNTYVGTEYEIKQKEQALLKEEWNNYFGDEDPVQDKVGVTAEMKGQLWDVGYSSVIVDGEYAW